MAERPILFSGAMVRAIRMGCKTQTRRIVRVPWGYACHAQPLGENFADVDGRMMFRGRDGAWHDFERSRPCPYGIPGDRLWVRESFAADRATGGYLYRADDTEEQQRAYPIRYKPSIHMPRAACRIVLEVVAVRVERLNAITFEDCLAEGIIHTPYWNAVTVDEIGAQGRVLSQDCPDLQPTDEQGDCINAGWNEYVHAAFRRAWDAINGERAAWGSNPWVWAVEFRKVDR